jgi:hypothetical protein
MQLQFVLLAADVYRAAKGDDIKQALIQSEIEWALTSPALALQFIYKYSDPAMAPKRPEDPKEDSQ